MEVAIYFLMKAVAGGAAGHYTKKALEKFDTNIFDMLKGGSTKEEIIEYVRENNLETQVEESAKDFVAQATFFFNQSLMI